MKNVSLYCSEKTLHGLFVRVLFFILVSVRICLAGQSQPQLQISAPANNTIVAPGQTLSFSVTSPAGLAFNLVGVLGEYPFGFSDQATSVPAQISYTIPPVLACRRYRFTAAGTTTLGQTYESAAIFIDIERPDAPLSLESDISSLIFKNIGERHRLRLIATFADGTSLEVSESTYISFSSSNTNIATVDQHGSVTAVASGTAYITAIYTIGNNKTQIVVPVTMGSSNGTGITSSGTFSLNVTPGQQTIIPGNSATFHVSASSFDGYAGTVALTAIGLPSGTSANFSPSSISISSSSTLIISTSGSTPTGAYIISIIGTSGGGSSTVNFAVIVGSMLPSYSYLIVQPNPQVIVGGQSANTGTASIQCAGTCTDVTTLTSSGLPSNVTATLTPSTINGAGSSTLALSATTSPTPGSYTLTVTGTSASQTLTAATTVKVWAHKDVGAVGVAGSTNYANGTGTFTISAAGPSIYNTADGMHFVYQPLSGDGSIVARIVTMSGMRSGTSARAGVMIRESLNANSSHSYSAYSTWDNPTGAPIGINLRRNTTGSSTTFTNSGAISLPYWVKMVRSGTSFSAYISPNGSSWTQVGPTQTIVMGNNVYAGLAVTSNDNNNNSLVTATIDNVTITASQWLPPSSPWSEMDLGAIGVPGNSGYSQGVYAVSAAGPQMNTTADGMHFLYQPLSGNGTIVARVLNVLDTQSGVSAYAGVMIRESLTSNSRHAFTAYRTSPTVVSFVARTTAGASPSITNSTNAPSPYWVKLVRNGSLFTAYFSPDGVAWTQVGTTQTISMATNAYIGLAVSSGNTNNNGLVTALFDNVSVTTATAAPTISSLSTSVGLPGNSVTITGTGFGATQGNSEVRLNGLAMQIDSWSATSVGVTISPGATSGPMTVAVAPGMNCSNPATFKVLPYPMLDRDIGAVGIAGNATYANGTYTVSAAGPSIFGTADGMHFVYKPLSGNGTIIARVVGVTGMRSGTSGRAGVMIRESLNANSTEATSAYSTWDNSTGAPIGIYLYRTSTGGSTSFTNSGAISAPYWVKLVRNGNVFSAYISPNGTSWTQVGGNQTISMATSVYVGLAVSSNDNNNNSLITATFDSFSVQ
jgi:hypothetical protein